MANMKMIAVLIAAIIIGSAAGYALLTNTEANDKEGPHMDEYPSSVTITQNDGTKVTVETPVERVCVVNPNAAEFMQVLNVTDRVVGVSESIAKDTEFGYIYDDVPTIGTYGTPNGELMLELNCRLVIGQCTSMAIKDTTVLEDLGISVVLLDCYGLDQGVDDLRQLAKLFGYEAQERAEKYIKTYNETVKAVAHATAALGDDVTAYMELSNGKAYTSKAAMSSLIKLAGGHNIVIDLVDDPSSSTHQISNEAVIAYDNGRGPEYIFVREGSITDSAVAEQRYQAITSREGWSGLEAVKNDNVYIITQAGILSGPRIYIGLVYLFEAFHPGVLDMTSAELLEEYNQAFGYDIAPMLGYRHVSA